MENSAQGVEGVKPNTIRQRRESTSVVPVVSCHKMGGIIRPMTRQDDGTPAIEGQKPIGEQHARRRERLRCPACRFKIHDEADHEPECPNGDWDRQDVIDHIMRVADRHNAEEKERQKREDDHVDKHELYGSGWPR